MNATFSPNATVTARHDPTPETSVVRIEPAGWSLPDFVPGQFATLALPDPADPSAKPLKRVYSIASEPGIGALEFYIRLVPSGDFTRRLWGRRVGDPVQLSEKITGRFTLDPVPAGADVVLVATGTGLAPYRSMLRHFGGSGRWGHLALLHGARTASELGFREEFTAAAVSDPSVAYLPTVTQEPAGREPELHRGRVQSLLEPAAFEAVAGFALDPERTHVFLCGNPAMIDQTEELLVPLGFRQHKTGEPGNLHFERWW